MPVRRGLLTFLLSVFFMSSVVVAQELPYEDGDFACTPKGEAEQIVRDFNIDVRSFGGMELCDASVDTKKLLNDFLLIKEGRFGDGAENLYIGPFVNRDNYYDWLIGMTRGIRRGHDVPYATAYNSWGYFTMQDGWAALSTLGRVGVLVHEARHTAGYGHIPCNKGPYRDTGVPGCDADISSGGSHAVEMEYYSRVVLQGENFHPAYQAMARLMALGRGNMVFNETPLSQRTALLASTPAELIIIDDGDMRSSSWQKSTDSRLKKTSAGASLVNLLEKSAMSIDLDGLGRWQEVLFHDEYSYYKIFDVYEAPSLVDMEEIDIGPKRYLVGLTSQGQLVKFVFTEGRWSRPLRVAGAHELETTAPNGEHGLFVRQGEGQICQVDLERWRCEATDLTWPKETRQFVVYNGQLLQLLSTGQVIYAHTGEFYEPLKGTVVEQILSVPLYNDLFEL